MASGELGTEHVNRTKRETGAIGACGELGTGHVNRTKREVR